MMEIDITLAHDLVRTQFPQWAHLPLKPILSAGTDNTIYRLGDDMAVRLPQTVSAALQIEKEQKWLPQLAPFLSLKIPIPLAHGIPSEGYPWSWSVYSWIEGENATPEHISDPCYAAIRLGTFISELQRIDIADGPLPGEHNFFRGVALGLRDKGVRTSLAALNGLIDVNAAASAWDSALQAPEWKTQPRWIHGDLHVGNLLAQEGRLSSVIDFGGLGVGDPACDIMAAWTYLSAETRPSFRDVVGVDDATWVRGRGWALSFGVIALPYYHIRNPVLAGIAKRAIDEVLADYKGEG